MFEPEEPVAYAVDEDEREQAVGGPNGQEVKRDRKRGDDERAGRDGQHDEAETEHEEEDVWGRVGDRVEVVDGLGCLAADAERVDQRRVGGRRDRRRRTPFWMRASSAGNGVGDRAAAMSPCCGGSLKR
jgi:hypothetical protein